uniref:Ribosomal protein S10 n=1 Tax=Synura synuroidea TaxID=47573 RepID=Q9MGA1_9STRA|nr:ribosomal protein S10 [Synura synuroidea]AAF36948.1 ribosomal protein S10 [Synura synuroidea]
MNKIIQEIKIKTVHKKCLILYNKFIIGILKLHNIKFSYFNYPSKKKTFTFLKSPHVHKKSKEHFHVVNYKSVFKLSINEKQLIKLLMMYKPTTLNIKIILNGR